MPKAIPWFIYPQAQNTTVRKGELVYTFFLSTCRLPHSYGIDTPCEHGVSWTLVGSW
jgi:hypothetical protein